MANLIFMKDLSENGKYKFLYKEITEDETKYWIIDVNENAEIISRMGICNKTYDMLMKA